MSLPLTSLRRLLFSVWHFLSVVSGLAQVLDYSFGYRNTTQGNLKGKRKPCDLRLKDLKLTSQLMTFTLWMPPHFYLFNLCNTRYNKTFCLVFPPNNPEEEAFLNLDHCPLNLVHRFVNFSVQTDHLGTLEKGRFWFSRSEWDPSSSFSNFSVLTTMLLVHGPHFGSKTLVESTG